MRRIQINRPSPNRPHSGECGYPVAAFARTRDIPVAAFARTRAIIGSCLVLASVVLGSGCQTSRAPEVVVYVAVDRQQAEPILKAFERSSGIRVLALYDAEAAKTTGLVTRLLAEAKRPNCDLFWNNEIAQTMMLAERGMLEPYHSPNAADIPAEWKDSEGLWTGLAIRARVIVYNTRLVSRHDAPRRLSDLTDARWRGKVAIANPQFGTTRTHVAALFAAWGQDSAEKFLRGLLANEARIVDGNAMVKNLVGRAQPQASPILVGLTDTDDVLAGQAEGEPIDMVFPDQDDLGTLVVPTTVCLLSGARHGSGARRLYDYLVSTEVGSRFASITSGYVPVRASRSGLMVTGSAIASARRLSASFAQIHEQLAASSDWTNKHFTDR